MDTKDPRSEYQAQLEWTEGLKVSYPCDLHIGSTFFDPAPVRSRAIAKPGFLSYIKALFSNWKGK